MTMDSPAPSTAPPEAVLIRRAREAKNISPETAATLLPFRYSGSSWRQIEAGYRGRARTPMRAKAAVLAQMARAMGVSSARLAEAGRSDAAEILREIELQEAERAQPTARNLEDIRDQLLAANARLGQMSAMKADKEGLLDEVIRLTEEYQRLAREYGDGPDAGGSRRRTA